MQSRRDANHADGAAGKGTAVSSDRHAARRAAKRVSPTEKKRGDGLERRPPAGIARERETSADDVAPCQGWGLRLFHDRRGVQADPIMGVCCENAVALGCRPSVWSRREGNAGVHTGTARRRRANRAMPAARMARFRAFFMLGGACGPNRSWAFLPVGAPPSRALSAGRLTGQFSRWGPGAHPTLSTGCQPRGRAGWPLRPAGGPA